MKTVVITGISKGIGKSLAQVFLDQGFSVIGTVTKADDTSSSQNLSIIELDLKNPQSIAGAVSKIVSLTESVDILINNAGVLLDEEKTTVDTVLLRETLEVNLVGTIDFTEKILPLIAENGQIINISSTAGSLSLSANPEDSHYPYHYPAYKISKCALNMYTRTLASRLNRDGRKITVSSVHPGWVRTEMGGNEAAVSPDEAAARIFKFALEAHPSGKFWHDGQELPW